MVDLRVLHNTMYVDVVRLLLTLCSVTSLSSAVSLSVVTVPDNGKLRQSLLSGYNTLQEQHSVLTDPL